MRTFLPLIAALVGLAGCPSSSSTGNAPPVGSATDVVSDSMTAPTLDPTTATSGTTDGASTTEGSSDSSSSGSSSTTAPTPTNCGDLQCSDNGSCEIDGTGSAYCECDAGYVFDASLQTCVVDESCIQVRLLDEDGSCRQKVSAEAAVAIFFGVDFCSGTAVTPEKIEELGLQFVVLENDVNIAANAESDEKIIEAEVESYVTLMLDVSNSVTQSEDLGALVTELRSTVATLEADPGEPDVYVSVFVFGLNVAEYVPFTRDLGAVDSALEAFAQDPAPVVELAGGGQSTALFRAAERGIQETQRIRALRDIVTWGGVLTTGTVVIVTDGLDTSNAMLNASLINTTSNQVISIGISSDINDDQLRAIGRDGSFLAPEPAQWTTAFEAIATRVDQYPERSYLLAYCSSASEGAPGVEVRVGGATLTSIEPANCTFNAELFSSQGFQCSTEFFDNECNTLACGGLTGCGACPDSQCCDGSQCVGTSSAADTGISCEGQSHTCEADNLTCVGEVCLQPDGDGQTCDVSPSLNGTCALGIDFCEVDETGETGEGSACVDTLPLGTPCSVPTQCASLNCYYPNPDNPFEGRRCLPESRIGAHCGTEDSICESGAFCQGSVCAPKRGELASCSSGDQCRRGACQSFDTGGSFCAGPAACYWSWDQKAN